MYVDSDDGYNIGNTTNKKPTVMKKNSLLWID